MPSPKYLLDTNILSDLIKQPGGIVAQKINHLGDEDLLCTSIIVACELRYGAFKKNSIPLTSRVNQLLEILTIMPLEDNVSSKYAELRTFLEKSGIPIGGNDLLIASQASCLDLIMVTANLREFSRIPDLKVENWLK